MATISRTTAIIIVIIVYGGDGNSVCAVSSAGVRRRARGLKMQKACAFATAVARRGCRRDNDDGNYRRVSPHAARSPRIGRVENNNGRFKFVFILGSGGEAKDCLFCLLWFCKDVYFNFIFFLRTLFFGWSEWSKNYRCRYKLGAPVAATARHLFTPTAEGEYSNRVVVTAG